jgi:putative flippase GtrA
MNGSRIEKVRVLVAGMRWRAFLRWSVVAVGFSGISIALLSLLVEALHLPLGGATLLAGELATLIRFFVTNRWVFGCKAVTWLGLWQFHCANALGFLVWWVLTTLLSHYGVYYLLAATVAIAGSSVFNLLTNFLWIWRRDGGTRSGSR